MEPKASAAPRSITESPWYWAYLFCTGGLIALVVVGPKYAVRQSHIEQNGQKRQWAAQLAVEGASSESPVESETLAVRLWPLFLVLGAVLAVAWIKLIRAHLRGRAAATELANPVDDAGAVRNDEFQGNVSVTGEHQ